MSEHDNRWLALYVLCAASLMIVLDTTIVNVALPSIRSDLGFSQTSLAWVINAYTLTFGGFLLLGGRLGDLYGHRRLFLGGITLFTLASAACGLAGSQGFLVTARAVQGLGGAVASAVSLSLMMTLFTEPADRAKAMGVFGFVASGGGSIGVLLGGILTDSINWHWIFLVNFPIGVLVVVLSLRLLPAARIPTAERRLDVAGAVTLTASPLAAVLAIRNCPLQARHAVRLPAAPGSGSAACRHGVGALPACAGRRTLPRRRAAEHDPARCRRGHGLQPGAAGSDERRRSGGIRPRLGSGQHLVH